ncbi:MAG: glycosyltransferase [Kiritimatiellales bacterium]
MAVELGRSCPRDGEFFDARNIRVVPNGIDMPPVTGNQKSASGNLRILYVGIHTESKGMFDLLETARELKQRGVTFEIRTAGLWYTDRERCRFDRMRKEYELESEVLTLGQKTGEELQALYGWANVFFFPTFYPWETFGIVQLEAMASSLPVVASDWQGPKDIVLNEETGFLCPVHDINAYATALQNLANDRELGRCLGRAGRRRYEQLYTANCFIRNMKQVFTDICCL